MVARLIRAVMVTPRGIGAAVRARPRTTLSVVGGILALQVFLPPLVLTVTRKPWTYFAFNPWLKRLPDYLVSSAPLGQKLDFLSRVALFWFSADGPYGFPEWGFAVDTMDLARFLAMSLLVGAYFALVLYRREQGRSARSRAGTSRAGGIVGALWECWASRRDRAAWWAAERRCSRSSAWSSPGCRAAPSPCSQAFRAS
jgi:hypothetical protein